MMGKENENGVKGGFQFHLPDRRSKWETFSNSIYNPSTNQFCGRTAKSWGQLLAFYTLFYIVLAILFAICMQGLLATLDDKAPKWTLDSSLIGTNPGMGFRPISNRTEEGSLIWYDIQNKTTSEKWIYLLDEFLQTYKINQTGGNFQTCDFGKKPDKDHVCTVDLDNFGNCSPKNSYGYNGSQPCVFLKLNKIFDWVPETYSTPDPDMSDDLKKKITETAENQKAQIWISCQGHNLMDQEHVSEFDYFPNRGFAAYYFPYTNTKNYLSPLIAVQIKNAKPNVIISIECRAWAKNIKYRGGDLQREGSVNFEILLDDNSNKTKQKNKEL